MTAVGWIVYGASIASVVFGLGLLIWTLQIRMTREMHGEVVATYHQARRKSDERRDADSDPNHRGDPVHSLDIHPLPKAERTRFVEDWQSLQPLFVNDPDDAVKEADRLISAVMQARGYPVEEFAQGAAEIEVDSSDIVSHYRTAHRVSQRAANGQATTDEERRALAEYRELFDELLGDGSPAESTTQSISQTG
jgi:hypothetical protein